VVHIHMIKFVCICLNVLYAVCCIVLQCVAVVGLGRKEAAHGTCSSTTQEMRLSTYLWSHGTNIMFDICTMTQKMCVMTDFKGYYTYCDSGNESCHTV